jgi:hypothetical protein
MQQNGWLAHNPALIIIEGDGGKAEVETLILQLAACR